MKKNNSILITALIVVLLAFGATAFVAWQKINETGFFKATAEMRASELKTAQEQLNLVNQKLNEQSVASNKADLTVSGLKQQNELLSTKNSDLNKALLELKSTNSDLVKKNDLLSSDNAKFYDNARNILIDALGSARSAYDSCTNDSTCFRDKISDIRERYVNRLDDKLGNCMYSKGRYYCNGVLVNNYYN